MKNQDKIAMIDIVLFDLEDYAFHGGLDNKSPEFISEYKRIAKQLERRKQKLLNPQPQRTRKPKAEHDKHHSPQPLIVVDTPTGLQITADSIQKRGRNG